LKKSLVAGATSIISDSLYTTYPLIIDAPVIDGKNTKNTQEESIPYQKQDKKTSRKR